MTFKTYLFLKKLHIVLTLKLCERYSNLGHANGSQNYLQLLRLYDQFLFHVNTMLYAESFNLS